MKTVLLIMMLLLPLASAQTTVFVYAGSNLVAGVGDDIDVFLGDRLGSNRLSVGEAVRSSRYLPFGQAMTDELEYGFTGKELDESGLHYFGARYFDADLGKFTTVDPVQGNNPYEYANSNPLMLVDPDGKENVRALEWAMGNLFNIPYKEYFQGSRWTYTSGTAPKQAVCYEACFMAYMNSEPEVIEYLKSGFTNEKGAFFGRSSEEGGRNYFYKGGLHHQLSMDILSGQKGDILFMGGDTGFAGHSVLVVEPPTPNYNQDGELTEVTIATWNQGEKVSGRLEYTFKKMRDGNFYHSPGAGQRPYLFRGFGQVDEQGILGEARTASQEQNTASPEMSAADYASYVREVEQFMRGQISTWPSLP